MEALSGQFACLVVGGMAFCSGRWTWKRYEIGADTAERPLRGKSETFKRGFLQKRFATAGERAVITYSVPHERYSMSNRMNSRGVKVLGRPQGSQQSTTSMPLRLQNARGASL